MLYGKLKMVLKYMDSYENKEILELLHLRGYEMELKDLEGKTPA